MGTLNGWTITKGQFPVTGTSQSPTLSFSLSFPLSLPLSPFPLALYFSFLNVSIQNQSNKTDFPLLNTVLKIKIYLMRHCWEKDHGSVHLGEAEQESYLE